MKCIKIFSQSVFLFIIIVTLSFRNVEPSEISINRVELLNSSYLKGYYNSSEFRVNKVNRSAFALNLDIEFLIDLDDDVSIEIGFYSKRLLNNEYQKSIVRVPKQSFCTFFAERYKRHFMEEWKDVSNFPQLKENESPCPLKKVNLEKS